jgi:hypothetical protein
MNISSFELGKETVLAKQVISYKPPMVSFKCSQTAGCCITERSVNISYLRHICLYPYGASVKLVLVAHPKRFVK